MSRRPPRRNWRPSFAPDCRLGPPRSVRGRVKVPGLGDPNVRESNSVSVVDVSPPATPKLETFIRTGLPFGPTVHGGSSPSGILAAAGRVFVSNANDDT